MVVNVLSLVPHCYTWEQGRIIADAIRKLLLDGKVAIVSFSGVGDITTSFANGAFVTLLDDYDYTLLRDKMQIINSNRQINDMIKRRLTFVSQYKQADRKLITS